MKTANFIAGLMGGLASGFLLGVLYAPNKGQKTRHLLKHRLNARMLDLIDNSKSTLDKMKTSIEDSKTDTEVHHSRVNNQTANMLKNYIAYKY